MNDPKLDELLPYNKDVKTILDTKQLAYKSAYDLLLYINSHHKDLQIATAESLTAGMIMSTLVDIPWWGYIKYGCIGVYDTDAKRTLIGVKVKDVYTHKCASEMAIGVLQNTNATISIAVTGNAMPTNDNVDKLGEVFISIAGYNKNNKIIYITKSINACIQTNNIEFKKLCNLWYNTIISDTSKKTYNAFSNTAAISQEIRYYTTYKALEICLKFIKKYKPVAPKIIIDRKNKNTLLKQIPKNKYNFGGEGICKNKSCDYTGIRKSSNIKSYKINSKYSEKIKSKKIKSKNNKNTKKISQ